MQSFDDHGQNGFYVDPDKVAAVRIILGLESYGHLRDIDGKAFQGIMSDMIEAALEKFVECPERVKLLFEQEKTTLELLDAVASDLGFRSWRGRSDVESTKIRDRLRELISKWKEAEEASQGGEVVDPTRLGGLLRVDYTISKRLSELENDATRKNRRRAR